MPSRTERRATLTRLAALAISATALPSVAQPRAALEPTPADAEGPFYPARRPTGADGDLTRVPGAARPARGTPLYLTGTVLGSDGVALAGAKIELWQCDASGRYHHVDQPGPLDEGFQGYGVVTSDAEGRFGFKTIRPVPYGSRPPHLHFKLAHARARPLTTQLYPRGESSERGMGFGVSDAATRARLEFVLAPARDREPGALASSYEFVLRTTG
jgi:protocatechuate 3,4-dioxygenase beta subunit